MKYTISMAVDGRVDIEVNAANPDEAKEKAVKAFKTTDLKKMELVEVSPATCLKDGIIVRYY